MFSGRGKYRKNFDEIPEIVCVSNDDRERPSDAVEKTAARHGPPIGQLEGRREQHAGSGVCVPNPATEATGVTNTTSRKVAVQARSNGQPQSSPQHSPVAFAVPMTLKAMGPSSPDTPPALSLQQPCQLGAHTHMPPTAATAGKHVMLVSNTVPRPAMLVSNTVPRPAMLVSNTVPRPAILTAPKSPPHAPPLSSALRHAGGAVTKVGMPLGLASASSDPSTAQGHRSTVTPQHLDRSSAGPPSSATCTAAGARIVPTRTAIPSGRSTSQKPGATSDTSTAGAASARAASHTGKRPVATTTPSQSNRTAAGAQHSTAMAMSPSTASSQSEYIKAAFAQQLLSSMSSRVTQVPGIAGKTAVSAARKIATPANKQTGTCTTQKTAKSVDQKPPSATDQRQTAWAGQPQFKTSQDERRSSSRQKSPPPVSSSDSLESSFRASRRNKGCLANVCEWKDCDFQFEDADRLKSHVLEGHLQEDDVREDLKCRWAGCVKVVESYRTRSELARHVTSHHLPSAARFVANGSKSRNFVPVNPHKSEPPAGYLPGVQSTDGRRKSSSQSTTGPRAATATTTAKFSSQRIVASAASKFGSQESADSMETGGEVDKDQAQASQCLPSTMLTATDDKAFIPGVGIELNENAKAPPPAARPGTPSVAEGSHFVGTTLPLSLTPSPLPKHQPSAAAAVAAANVAAVASSGPRKLDKPSAGSDPYGEGVLVAGRPGQTPHAGAGVQGGSGNTMSAMPQGASPDGTVTVPKRNSFSTEHVNLLRDTSDTDNDSTTSLESAVVDADMVVEDVDDNDCLAADSNTGAADGGHAAGAHPDLQGRKESAQRQANPQEAMREATQEANRMRAILPRVLLNVPAAWAGSGPTSMAARAVEEMIQRSKLTLTEHSYSKPGVQAVQVYVAPGQCRPLISPVQLARGCCVGSDSIVAAHTRRATCAECQVRKYTSQLRNPLPIPIVTPSGTLKVALCTRRCWMRFALRHVNLKYASKDCTPFKGASQARLNVARRDVGLPLVHIPEPSKPEQPPKQQQVGVPRFKSKPKLSKAQLAKRKRQQLQERHKRQAARKRTTMQPAVAEQHARKVGNDTQEMPEKIAVTVTTQKVLEKIASDQSSTGNQSIPLLPTYNVTSAVSATKKFDWAAYLRETDSKAAPDYCFPERHFPESNLFQVDMKVEMACDLSQSPSNAYLMTVAQIIGMRVRLTYYGGAEGSGVMRSIDAADIFPLGWCASNGGRIVAPPDCQPSFAQNWPEYIEQVLETAVGVPETSFPKRAARTARDLQPGHKLEMSLVEDGQVRYCVATVAAVSPTSVTIHLDGYEDDSAYYHSFPRDSPQLHPVGYCQGQSLKLWPPEGVTEEMFGWQSYLTFTKAEKAPEEFFRNQRNLFMAGMKLEAVDSRNPHMICVATVAEVLGDNIKVHFDGWSDKFDALVSKDDETIFPVGWCAKCGLNVQPPLQKVAPSKHIRSLSSEVSPLSPSAYQLGMGKRKKRLSPGEISPPHKRRASSGAGSIGGKSSAPKAVFNINCDTGPYLDPQKVKSLPIEISGSSVAVVLQRTLQHLIDSSIDQRIVFDFVRSGNSTTNVHCVLPNGERLIKHLQVVDRNNILWGIIRQMLGKLQCCERFITARNMSQCTRCSTSVGNAGPFDGAGGMEAPADQSFMSENSWLSSSPAASHTSKRDTEGMTPLGQTYNPNRPVVSASNGSAVSLLSSIASNDPDLFSSPQIEYLATKHPKLWTVDDVRAYFDCSDCANHVATLVEQEIDGNAMLLLTPDTLVRFMGLRLGPSLKICGRVDNLKSKWNVH